jgi:hypothetical protein
MKRHYINVILFLIPIFLLGLINIFYSNTTKISEVENRALKSKPKISIESVFSGEYSKEFDEYYSDTFFMRDSFVLISRELERFKGLTNNDGVEIVMHKGANVAFAQEIIQSDDVKLNESRTDESIFNEIETMNKHEGYYELKKRTVEQNQGTEGDEEFEEDEHEELQIEEPDNVAKEENKLVGSILIMNDTAMEIFYMNGDACLYYADTINSFQEELEGSEGENPVTVFSMLVPTQIEFIDNEKYRAMSSSQEFAIDYVNDNLNESIVTINAYDALKNNKEKYMYFRTDHHWTALGAYYAYTAFMDAINEDAISLEQYEVTKVEDYLGSTYSTTLSKALKDNPDTIYLYNPFTENKYYVYYEGPLEMDVIDMNHADKTRKYRIFLSGDRPWGKIITEVKNGKKIVVIKDSYANAFVPFLIPHYEEIYVVDPRQFELNILDFIEENKIQEVLVLNYAPVVSYNGFTDLILDMMNR